MGVALSNGTSVSNEAWTWNAMDEVQHEQGGLHMLMGWVICKQ